MRQLERDTSACSASAAPDPDRSAALDQYRRRASVYDLELLLFEPVRREALAWLAPNAGRHRDRRRLRHRA